MHESEKWEWSRSVVPAAAKPLQSCQTLCDPIDGSPPSSPVPGILQARTLEWVAISFSNAWKWKVKEVSQSCPTLSDPMDCSPPGSSVHGFSRQEYWSGVQYMNKYTQIPLITHHLGKLRKRWATQELLTTNRIVLGRSSQDIYPSAPFLTPSH